MPSEKQVRWSQLRVGLTVIFASITLGVLIFVMTGTTGLFTKKIDRFVPTSTMPAGCVWARAVGLEGVDIGNVTGVRVVADPLRALAPVELVMKITTKYEDTMNWGCQATADYGGRPGRGLRRHGLSRSQGR